MYVYHIKVHACIHSTFIYTRTYIYTSTYIYICTMFLNVQVGDYHVLKCITQTLISSKVLTAFGPDQDA